MIFWIALRKPAACGFRAVEFMFPYDYAPEVLKQKLSDNRLEHTLHNLPAGDWAGGERGIACIPGREAEFREGVDAAVRYAKALGNRKINCLVGKPRLAIARIISVPHWWRIYVLPPPRWRRKVFCC
ncbi:Hydroxypyruvate isomerase [Raoultella planticola]|uniref:Hydroxypyruvate isomerase n=1 Tax=Raoultella planticola TaxID=575 RepID=A0A485DAX1_RAOPL|nr:Hydroxypyruvate isomerase [Raoultella planticola]